LKPSIRIRTVEEQARIDAEVEAILSSEEELIPSSGFLASVMERVEEESAVPPPIPFPWKRAIPGMVLSAGVFGWSLLELTREGLPALNSLLLTPPHLPPALVAPVESAGWVTLALGVSLFSWLLSRHLVGRGGLL
jgi:hypothetical protein